MRLLPSDGSCEKVSMPYIAPYIVGAVTTAPAEVTVSVYDALVWDVSASSQESTCNVRVVTGATRWGTFGDARLACCIISVYRCTARVSRADWSLAGLAATLMPKVVATANGGPAACRQSETLGTGHTTPHGAWDGGGCGFSSRT